MNDEADKLAWLGSLAACRHMHTMTLLAVPSRASQSSNCGAHWAPIMSKKNANGRLVRPTGVLGSSDSEGERERESLIEPVTAKRA